jgi:penicillin-binding protein 1C
MKLRALIAAGGLLFFATLIWCTRPLDRATLGRSAGTITFLDRNGLSLGTVVGNDGNRESDVPLDAISPSFINALIDAEDERFFRHGAVSGEGLVRALARGLHEGEFPHGGSTISMQLARTLHPVGDGPADKLAEIAGALRLENTYDKRRILAAYCNRAPMGSNIAGVEEAARQYFGTPAAGLDVARASLLAALPNDPVRLDPYRHWKALKARQRYVLERMVAAGDLTPDGAAFAWNEHVALRPPASGIYAAPHYLFRLAAARGAGDAVVTTTIDRPLQAFVEEQVRAVVHQLADRNVNDGAAIVLDNATGDILAYAGSPDYFDVAAGGRNDGVTALRQPGSTLKPFLYALALQNGTLQSTSMLEDAPIAYALPGARLYEPSDYSNHYLGNVRVRVALADSLNVPAVRVLERVGVPAFLERLRALGFTHLNRNAEYYGLGLALGGGEVTLEELARAYRELAISREPEGLLVTDMLADPHARAAAFGVDSILALPFAAAVKTGTSSGHRDTWTVGFTRDYTVATWAGNFDGSAMRGVSGVSGAAPLWARIMLHVHERHEPAGFDPPPGYARRAICAENGAPATRGCTAVAEYVRMGMPAERAVRVPSPAFAMTFPRDGDRFVFAGAQSGRLRLRFTAPADRVDVDGRPLARSGDAYVWTVSPGLHIVSARHNSASIRARIDVGPPIAPLHRGFTT